MPRFARGVHPSGHRVAAGALVALVAACALAVLLPGLPEQLAIAVDDLATAAAALLAASLAALAARRVRRPRERLAWLLLGLAFLSNVMAEVVWAYYDLIAWVEAPSPSVSDAFYMFFYPAAVTGVLLLRRRPAGRLAGWTTGLDALTFTLGLAGLSWQLIIKPSLEGAEGGVLGHVALAYPVLDLVLIYASASLFLRWDLQRVALPLVLVLASNAAMVTADLAYAWLSLSGQYTAASAIDPIWVLCYALLGLAALARLRAARGEAGDDASDAHPTTRYWLDLTRARHVRVALPYVSFPAVALLLHLHFGTATFTIDIQARAIFGFTVAVFGLIILRQYLTIVENSRLSRSLTESAQILEVRVAERTAELAALNRAATALSHCLTVKDVAHTGLDLAMDATRSAQGLVWVIRPDEAAEVIAERGIPGEAALTLRVLPPEEPHLAELMAGREAPSMELAGPHDHASQPTSGAPRSGHLLLTPLPSRGATIGVLGLVDPGNAEVPSRRQLLQSIAAHLGVALENARLYDTTRYLAERDSLTELLNHRALHTRLGQEILRAERSRGEFAVVMMDLDGFKRFNDTYGHPVGDDVLRMVASVLRDTLRASDVVGRSGGDEFMAILPDTDHAGAREMAHRVRDLLAERAWVSPDGVAEPIQLSFGIAAYPSDGRRAREIISVADANLYRSKDLGGIVVAGDDHLEAPRGSRR